MKRLRNHKAVVVVLSALVLMGTVVLTTFITVTEIAAPSAPAAGSAGLYADSTSHTWKASSNGGSWFDIITSATGATLYCLLTGCTLTGQFQDTLNPASTAFTGGTIIANPAACSTDEILVGAGVAGTAKATMDCDGDIVGVKGTFSGQVQSNSTNVLTTYTSNFTMVVFAGNLGTLPAANTKLGTFVVSSAATLTRLAYVQQSGGTAGTGTGTIDVCDSGGTSLCSINVTCTTLNTAGTSVVGTCNAALAAGTYELRMKAQCGGTNSVGGLATTTTYTTP